MKRSIGLSLFVVAWLTCATVVGAQKKNETKASDIARAISAAPASIGEGAAVAEMDEQGKLTELRHGRNGWTCLVHDPGTPKGHPLCLDGNGLQWMADSMAGRVPAADKTGYSYMLQGGTSWSNLDVSATKLPPGQKKYITIPPHIMVMNAKIAQESGFPSGEQYPDTSKPFVMYGGTPYAIVMIPIPAAHRAK